MNKESEIDKLKIVFRMPSYLQVKDDSFSLTEPKHVLKGDTQYKLVWDFTRFERGDTRLLGFNLVNKRGILGDVRLPDLDEIASAMEISQDEIKKEIFPSPAGEDAENKK